MICHGWNIFFHPLFAERFHTLRADAEKLKGNLTDADYRTHPKVRLLASVVRLIRDIVPENPNAPEFQLRGNLSKFRRAKSRGLPARYRLFWIFSSKVKVIIFLYLNDDNTFRKEGSPNDPYELFRAMVRQGSIGDDFEANRTIINEENRNQNPP